MPDQKPVLNYRRPEGQHLPAFEVFVLIAKWGALSLIGFGLFLMVLAAVFRVL
ncbi:MAG TPA: hypothetical protein VK797_01870 [Tepidisphaeraceae bacterium]|jgi:hypothetical protein|nr:hypothetical protein [Tepidisphaeraceae bacterium]